MTAAKVAPAPSMYVSGFCGVGRHQQCRGVFAGVDCTCGCHTEPEPVVVVVHCFFGCEHIARDADLLQAHDALEGHYRLAHWAQIRAAVGWEP